MTSTRPIIVVVLRERRSDIPELLAHFLRRSAQRLQIDPCELDPAAVEMLCQYDWPGNVRELENIVSRASVLNVGGPITADSLRTWLSPQRAGASIEKTDVHRWSRGRKYSAGPEFGSDGTKTDRSDARSLRRPSRQNRPGLGHRPANTVGKTETIRLRTTGESVCQAELTNHFDRAVSAASMRPNLPVEEHHQINSQFNHVRIRNRMLA